MKRYRSLASPQASTYSARQFDTTQLWALAIALTLALQVPSISSLTVGMALAALTFPVSILPLLRLKGLVRILLILTILAIMVGSLLAAGSISNEYARQWDLQLALYQSFMPLSLVWYAISALWCIRKLGLTKFFAAWAVSLLTSALLNPAIFDSNPWKYGLALPLSVLISLLFAKFFRHGWLLGLLTIAAISSVMSFRSWLLVTTISAVVSFISRAKSHSSQRARSTYTKMTIFGIAGLAITWLLPVVSTAGLLGADIKRRTEQQLETGGNILLGGRPEWASAIELFIRDPLGHGVGVGPSGSDYLSAVRAMPLSDPRLADSTTVAFYFRQDMFEFHSVFWGFWSHFGLVGIAIVLVIFVCALRAIASLMNNHMKPAHTVCSSVVIVSILWDLLFSPLHIPSLGTGIAIIIYIHSLAAKGRKKSRDWITK